jgi:hypothetical protein
MNATPAFRPQSTLWQRMGRAYSISFIHVATNLALRDEAYRFANLARLQDLFTLGANCTRLEIERITPPKKSRKKK